jgi:hypothetical protein
MKNKKKHLMLLGIFMLGMASLHAQTPAPVPESKSQAPLNWVSVTMTKEELLAAGRLSALYPEDKRIDTTVLEIRRYQISIFGKTRDLITGLDHMGFGTPVRDQFPEGLPELIKSLKAGDKIYFEYIKAYKIGSADQKPRSIPALSVTLSDN